MAELDVRTRAAETTPVGTPAGLRLVVGGAAVLVVYSYLGGLWLNRHGYSPATLVAVRDWLNKPAGIGEDFGVFGVALLLLVAGYRMPTVRVRRMLVVAGPVVLVAVTASAAILLLGGDPYSAPDRPGVTPLGYVTNVLLVDRIAGQPAYVALTWPVTVAVLAVLLRFAATRLRQRVLNLAVRFVALAALVVFGPTAPAALHQLGQLAGFAALCLLGEVLAEVRAKRMHGLVGAALGVLAFGVLVLADHRYDEWHGYWYPVTALYALLVVLLVLPTGEVLAATAAVRWLSSRALWLIAAAAVAGWAVLGLGYLRAPLPVSVLAAVIATIVVAEAGFRFVQRPLGGAR